MFFKCNTCVRYTPVLYMLFYTCDTCEHIPVLYVRNMCISITKLPESGYQCGNITKFGVMEGSPEPAG